MLLSLMCAFSALAQETTEKKEIVKKGYNFGPLPAVAFDADKGFQLGALLNIYDLATVQYTQIPASSGILRHHSLQKAHSCL